MITKANLKAIKDAALKALQFVCIFLFKKTIVRDMKKNGFFRTEHMTVKQLHRFWCKTYA